MIQSKAHYSKALAQYPSLFDDSKTVLEVGANGEGISAFLQRPVTVFSHQVMSVSNEWITPVSGDYLDLGFDDDAFDFVIGSHLLESLDEKGGATAVRELVRVARDTVILISPCNSLADAGERALCEVFEKHAVTVPEELKQRTSKALPKLEILYASVAACGFRFSFCGNEGMLQHYAGILLDTFYPLSGLLVDRQSQKQMLSVPLADSSWDFYYSYLFSIDKRRMLTVDSARLTEVSPAANNAGHTDCLLQLYAVYHDDFPVRHLQGVTPVYVGPAAEDALEGQLTDVPATASPLDNARWSEMSAIYKVWMDQLPGQYVGFCHYRRVFDFSMSILPQRSKSARYEALLADADLQLIQPDMSLLQEQRILLPPPIKLGISIWDQYCNAHKTDDLCYILDQVAEKYPALLPQVYQLFTADEFYANNMFIMSRNLFNELCNFWFDILQSFEQHEGQLSPDRYQGRDIAFLSERLFHLWIMHKQSRGIELLHVPFYQVEFDGVDVTQWSKPSCYDEAGYS